MSARNIHEDIHAAIQGTVFLRVYLVRHAESKENVVYFPWIPEEEHDILTAEGQR